MNRYVGIFRRCELLYYRTEMKKFHLAPLEGKLLALLKDNCCTQEELGAQMNLDKGRIANTVSLLEEKHLLRRVVNEKNKRQKLVSLTETGEKMAEEINKIFFQWNEICYFGFSEEEKQIHQNHLKRITENAMEYRKHIEEDINGKKFDGR